MDVMRLYHFLAFIYYLFMYSIFIYIYIYGSIYAFQLKYMYTASAINLIFSQPTCHAVKTAMVNQKIYEAYQIERLK